MAELADALDLGSSSREWGFKSLYPHQIGPSKPLGFTGPIFCYIKVIKGLELGASNFSCVFADRRKNSPLDYFAGGSREASPFIRTIKA